MPVTVDRVVDGDTIDVRDGDDTGRVRLLNVDTPETKHPEEEIECLGPEATAFLEEQLPVGQEIELEFDEELTDQYDRVLAGVYKDGELINAEVARAGFGVAVSYEPNMRFYDEVSGAQQEAERAGVGLFDDDQECTLTSLISAAEEKMVAVPEDLAEDAAGLEEQLAAVLAAGGAVAAVLEAIDVFAEFPDAAVAVGFSGHFENVARDMRRHEEKVQGLKDSVDERIESIEEEERLEAERTEEERREAERAAAKRNQQQESVPEQRQQPAPAPTAQPVPQPTRTAEPTPAPAPATQPAPQPTRTAEPAPPRPSSAAPEPAPAPSTSNQNNGGNGGTPNLGPKEAPDGYFHREAPTDYTGPRCFLPGGNWWKPC